MILKRNSLIILVCFSSCFQFYTTAQPVKYDYVFKSGDDGYATFRIPAIITTNPGKILAFAEGRVKSSSDNGNIDLVMKSSDDDGKTWSKLKVIWNDGENACQNPAPVIDRQTRIISFSNDGGESWSDLQPVETLPEPICQASILFSPVNKKLYFLNPADENNRVKMTLKSSTEEGFSWKTEQVLHAGPSAYSDLTLINKNTLGCLFEAGDLSAYEGIVFATFEIKH